MANDDGLLVVVRDVDDERIVYEVPVPRRRLVSVMREENLKPGDIVSAHLVPA